MLKVRILTTCEHCNGQTYLPFEEVEDYKGEKYTRYLPCRACHGSGIQAMWVSLEQFATLLRQAQDSLNEPTI